MIPGCTTTLEFEIDDDTVDLDPATNVYVSIRQGVHNIVKTGESLTIDRNNVTVTLTQEESLRLRPDSPAEVQINWLYEDLSGATVRAATETAVIDIGKQLLPRVLP